jgi:RimJ/RimL family protein N-acetyltransferase
VNAEGFLVAGVVYHNYNPEAGIIEISAAALPHHRGTRAWLQTIFSYPFDRCGCQMVIARSSENNPGPAAILRRLGASEYRIPRLRGPDCAEIISTLTVEDWKNGPWA